MNETRPATDLAPARRIPELDVLRALAIVLVLFHHSVTRWTDVTPPVPYALFVVGYTGVDLFFVLSGFLVAGLLFRDATLHGRPRIGRFLVRRAFKIWPPYVVFVAFVAVLGWRGPVDVELWPMVVFLQNYVPVAIGGHTWSLAVEEHFYLLLPVVFATVLRDPRSWGLPGCVAAIMAASVAIRWVEDPGLPAIQTHQRLDGLFLGVLLAWIQNRSPPTFSRLTHPVGLLLIAGPGLVAAAHLPWPGWSTVAQNALAPTLVSLGYAMVVLAALGLRRVPLVQRWRGSAVGRAVAYGGEHSYSVYLWHAELSLPLVWLGARALGLSLVDPSGVGWLGAVGVYWGVSFGVGILLSRGIEAPMLALRDRWVP